MLAEISTLARSFHYFFGHFHIFTVEGGKWSEKVCVQKVLFLYKIYQVFTFKLLNFFSIIACLCNYS